MASKEFLIDVKKHVIENLKDREVDDKEIEEISEMLDLYIEDYNLNN